MKVGNFRSYGSTTQITTSLKRTDIKQATLKSKKSELVKAPALPTHSKLANASHYRASSTTVRKTRCTLVSHHTDTFKSTKELIADILPKNVLLGKFFFSSQVQRKLDEARKLNLTHRVPKITEVVMKTAVELSS